MVWLYIFFFFFGLVWVGRGRILVFGVFPHNMHDRIIGV
jgi:hypothetical protein